MSLLDDNFDLCIEELVAGSLKKLITCFTSPLRKYTKNLPFFTEGTVPRVHVDKIEYNESGKYYIGYNYLAPSNKISFKLFNPDNHKVRNDNNRFDLLGYCRIGNYSIIGATKKCDKWEFSDNVYRGFRGFVWGWIKLSIDDIISGELYNPEIVTPTDEIIKQCQTSINNGQWVC